MSILLHEFKLVTAYFISFRSQRCSLPIIIPRWERRKKKKEGRRESKEKKGRKKKRDREEGKGKGSNLAS